MNKRPGMSGYFSIASSLHDVYKCHGCLSAADLERITVEKCTRIFCQDPANQIIRELMQHFATALNDLGRYLLDRFNGNFAALAEAAESSAGRFVQLLKEMPYFNTDLLIKADNKQLATCKHGVFYGIRIRFQPQAHCVLRS